MSYCILWLLKYVAIENLLFWSCPQKIIIELFQILAMFCSATLLTEPQRPLHRNDMRPYPRPSPDQPFPGLDLPRLYTFHTTPYHLSLTSRSVLDSEFL